MTNKTSAKRTIHGETIVGVKYHHGDQWILFLMKSGRVYKITTASYYGGESDVNLNEVDKEEWNVE